MVMRVVCEGDTCDVCLSIYVCGVVCVYRIMIQCVLSRSDLRNVCVCVWWLLMYVCARYVDVGYVVCVSVVSCRYATDEMAVIVAGDFKDKPEVLALIDKYIKPIPKRTAPKPMPTWPVKIPMGITCVPQTGTVQCSTIRYQVSTVIIVFSIFESHSS